MACCYSSPQANTDRHVVKHTGAGVECINFFLYSEHFTVTALSMLFILFFFSHPWSVPGNNPCAVLTSSTIGTSRLCTSEAPEAQQQRTWQRCQASDVALSLSARPQKRQHGGRHACCAWPGLEMGKPRWWRGPCGYCGGDRASGQHYNSRQDGGGAVGQRHKNQLPYWLPGCLWPAALW